MDAWSGLLSLSSTAANTWFLVGLAHRGFFTQDFVFLTHLTGEHLHPPLFIYTYIKNTQLLILPVIDGACAVFDVLHDFHGALYRSTSLHFLLPDRDGAAAAADPRPWEEPWLRLNQFAGLCLYFAPLLAILLTVGRGLFRSGRRRRRGRGRTAAAAAAAAESSSASWSQFKGRLRLEQFWLWAVGVAMAAPALLVAEDVAGFG